MCVTFAALYSTDEKIVIFSQLLRTLVIIMSYFDIANEKNIKS